MKASPRHRPDSQRQAIRLCSGSHCENVVNAEANADENIRPPSRWRFLTSQATGLHIQTPSESSFRCESSLSLASSARELPLVRPPSRQVTPRHRQRTLNAPLSSSLPSRILRNRIVLDKELVGWGAQGPALEGLLIDDAVSLPLPPCTLPSPNKHHLQRTLQKGNKPVAPLPWDNFPSSGPSRPSTSESSDPIVVRAISSLVAPAPDPVAPASLEGHEKKVRFNDEAPKDEAPKLRRRSSRGGSIPEETDDRATDLSRRSSRAMFLERMQVLKETLGRAVQDVATSFNFVQHPDQLESLEDVVRGIDEVILGQEYATVHPIQTQLSNLTEDARQFEALYNQMRGAPTTRHCGVPQPPPHHRHLHQSQVTARTEMSHSTSLRPGEDAVEATTNTASVFGRRDSAYYLRVAEEKRRTGAATSGDQLYITAEDIERQNAAHLGAMIPKHDQSMADLVSLGLV